MDYEIEKDVEVPIVGLRHKYPFNQMEVGDSFLFKGDSLGKDAVKAAAYTYGRRHDMKFIVRDISSTSCRIWKSE